MNSIKDLRDGLINLGINKGDTVLVHSSFKALGQMEKGAMGVYDALFDAVGSKGTIVFPTLTFSPVYQTKVFDVTKTPSCVGYLSDTFRKLKGAKRSMHPTHSCTAIGDESKYLIENHEKDETPIGANSPFTKLPIIGGKILMLGVGLAPMTSMHGVEETVEQVFITKEKTEYTMIDENKNQFIMSVRRHAFITQSYGQRYDRLETALTKDAFTCGDVVGAKSYLVDATKLWKQAHDIIKKDPYYFVEKMDFNR